MKVFDTAFPERCDEGRFQLLLSDCARDVVDNDIRWSRFFRPVAARRSM